MVLVLVLVMVLVQGLAVQAEQPQLASKLEGPLEADGPAGQRARCQSVKEHTEEEREHERQMVKGRDSKARYE